MKTEDKYDANSFPSIILSVLFWNLYFKDHYKVFMCLLFFEQNTSNSSLNEEKNNKRLKSHTIFLIGLKFIF